MKRERFRDNKDIVKRESEIEREREGGGRREREREREKYARAQKPIYPNRCEG